MLHKSRDTTVSSFAVAEGVDKDNARVLVLQQLSQTYSSLPEKENLKTVAGI